MTAKFTFLTCRGTAKFGTIYRDKQMPLSLYINSEYPGNPTGRGLTPKVKEIAPSGFLQNVRLVKVTLPPQEENLGQPRF